MGNTKYEKEVRATSFTTEANYHRNTNRRIVEKFFKKRDKSVSKNKETAARFDAKARQVWREIVTESNTM
jgi:hypothetical protein